MCPMFKNLECEIVGIEPEYLDCVDEECCYSNPDAYKSCNVYRVNTVVEIVMQLTGKAA